MLDDYEGDEIIEGIISPVEESPYQKKLPKGYLSVSQVAQYLKCGEAYRRRYVLEQPVKGSVAAAQGKSIHRAAELLHKSMINNAPISSEETVQIYADQHETEMKEVTPTEDDGDIKALKDVGVGMVRKYHNYAVNGGMDANNVYVPPLKPIAAEKQFKVFLNTLHDDPIPFVGVVDLEEEDAIADLKTKAKPATQADAENSLQLSLYAHVTGKPLVRLDQLIKPTKTLPVRYMRTIAVKNKKETLHAVDVVADVAVDIAAGRFRRTNPENWWCSEKWCAYWGDCRGKTR